MLCTEVGVLLDQVINAHMVAVFSILDTSEPINPRLAGYFDKVSKQAVSWTMITHVVTRRVYKRLLFHATRAHLTTLRPLPP